MGGGIAGSRTRGQGGGWMAYACMHARSRDHTHPPPAQARASALASTLNPMVASLSSPLAMSTAMLAPISTCSNRRHGVGGRMCGGDDTSGWVGGSRAANGRPTRAPIPLRSCSVSSTTHAAVDAQLLAHQLRDELGAVGAHAHALRGGEGRGRAPGVTRACEGGGADGSTRTNASTLPVP